MEEKKRKNKFLSYKYVKLYRCFCFCWQSPLAALGSISAFSEAERARKERRTEGVESGRRVGYKRS